MVAFLYRMPAGIPGDTSRASQATVESQLYDAAAPFSAYGLPVKISSVNGKAQPVGAGDAATAVVGFLARPYPTNSSQEPLGVAVPATIGVCNVMVRGYMSVLLSSGSVSAVKNGQVYIRVASAAAGKPLGGIEAAADSANTIAVPSCHFMGPADANGITELSFNV